MIFRKYETGELVHPVTLENTGSQKPSAKPSNKITGLWGWETKTFGYPAEFEAPKGPFVEFEATGYNEATKIAHPSLFLPRDTPSGADEAIEILLRTRPARRPI